MKSLFIGLGGVAFALGVAGIFLPLVPTTPFLLLAAALWVRSSPRLYGWLLSHPVVGRYLRNFRENRAIPLPTKVGLLSVMWASMLFCVFGLLTERLWAQALLLAVAVGVTWHILSFPTLKE